jgi:hypothetical protein
MENVSLHGLVRLQEAYKPCASCVDAHLGARPCAGIKSSISRTDGIFDLYRLVEGCFIPSVLRPKTKMYHKHWSSL